MTHENSHETATSIGIDLGTTHSLIAIVEGGRPRILRNRLGSALTPSAVSLIDGEVVVGAAALARRVTHPELSAVAFKRDMGTKIHRRLDDHELSPPALSALLLKALREDAEAALGRPVTEAVITVPAYFDDSQRRATREAAHLAGLPVERLINEPTAAAIAYGLHELDREQRALVFDLGGGTFDVTVLEIIEGVIEVQATAGDSRLGGEDFTTALAKLVCARAPGGLELKPDSVGWVRLLEAAERAKKQLTREETVELRLPRALNSLGETRELAVPLTRQDLEQAWQPLLERLKGPIHRALRDAALQPGDIDEVLMVGGSTRMPAVRALAEEIFEQPANTQLPADETVVLGAALQAALKAGDHSVEELVVTDIAPFTLGVDTTVETRGHRVSDIYSPIIERGTVIPTSRSQRYSTIYDLQKQIDLDIFQGEHIRCRDNRHIGEISVGPIPPNPAGHEAIEVRFTYDLNGILEVDVEVLSTGERFSTMIENNPGRLGPEELEKARQQLSRLKFHPRDALPNTAALARAEALYPELTGEARNMLGQYIGAFRAVLESQDPVEIEAFRDQLNHLTQSLK